MSYAEFSKKVGVTKSMLFRLENGQESITLTWICHTEVAGRT
jgi:hypothetical protein